MKMFSAVLLALAAVVAADYEPIELDYHTKIGIPLAERLKAEAANEVPAARISGGEAISASVHPYMVGVVIDLTNGHSSTCGAVMLSNTHSVTAAHCWKDKKYQARQFILAFGTNNIYSGGTRVTTTDVKLHPDYNPKNLNNDIAIITHSWVNYTDIIQPINLPSADLLSSDFVGEEAWVVGFGNTADDAPGTSNEDKYQVRLQVITNTVCTQTYGSSAITDSTLCVSTAGGLSTCPGDSGGPLTITNNKKPVLIGISSFESDQGCQKGLPAVFTRVTSFVSWIQDKI